MSNIALVYRHYVTCCWP